MTGNQNPTTGAISAVLSKRPELHEADIVRLLSEIGILTTQHQVRQTRQKGVQAVSDPVDLLRPFVQMGVTEAAAEAVVDWKASA